MYLASGLLRAQLRFLARVFSTLFQYFRLLRSLDLTRHRQCLFVPSENIGNAWHLQFGRIMLLHSAMLRPALFAYLANVSNHIEPSNFRLCRMLPEPAMSRLHTLA